MIRISVRLLAMFLLCGVLSSVRAQSPAAPKMPPPAPIKGGGSQVSKGGSSGAQQGQQAQRPPHNWENDKLRPGNTAGGGGGGGETKNDGELELTGVIAQGAVSPGQPAAFTLTDENGKKYELKGKETSLRRLVSKTVDLTGEVDKKDGLLKVRSVRESKAKPIAGIKSE